MFDQERGLKILSVLALPYAMSVALGWSLGYWKSFGINPFEYAGPAEIVSLSAYALAASLTTFVITLFIMRMFMQCPGVHSLRTWFYSRFEKSIGPMPELPSEENFTSERIEDYDKKIEIVKNNLRMVEARIFAIRLLIVIAAILAAFFAYFKQSPVLLGMFALTPVFFFLAADPLPEWIKEALSQNVMAEIALCIVISLPVVAFLYGAQKAFQIMEGQGSMLLFDVEELDVQKGGIYVGRMGGHIFTYDICSTYVEVKKDDVLSSFKLVSNAIVQCDDGSKALSDVELDNANPVSETAPIIENDN
ncbi:hypothetical protein [Vreelandella titanicae]|uniref:hypothetical protein n=1 Tax=Vreelandella titanicae TaxID=664683 RepID=UPI001141A1CA|nr:hypothetical protein [Halomonas titanicae]